MSPVLPLSDLVGALRHDVVGVSLSGDDTVAVRGVELLDRHAGEAGGPGHLLLGVGLNTGDAAESESAVRIASDSLGVLVIKSREQPPADFLGRARRAGVPVVSIDDRVPWSSVQRLMSTLLATHPGGDAAPAAGGDLFVLANSVAAATGGATAIMDTGQTIVAYSNLPDQPIDETRRRGILGRQVPQEALPDHLSGEVWGSESVVRHQRDGDLPRLAVVIRAGAEVLGSLWAAFPGHLPIPDCAATLHQAARLAAVHMLALRRHLKADQDSRDLAFRTALEQPGADTAELRLPAVLLGADLPGTADPHSASLLRVLDLFATDGRALGHLPALALSDDRIYGLLPVSRPGAVPVNGLIAHLLSRVQRTLCLEITVVSGTQVRAAADLHLARRDIDTALDHLRGSEAEPRHYTTDELRVELVHKRLIDSVRADPLLRGGQGERITTHDREHATAFAATLRCYLRHFGDVGAASADLHIHQNTLRQRLRRAQELFALDLGDPAQRLVLELELAAAAADR